LSKSKRHGRTEKLPPKQSSAALRFAWIPSAVGLAVSVYLLALELSGSPAFCPTEYGCDIVRNSAFARILGTPVAAVGVLFFAAVLGLCLTRTSWRDRWLVPLAGMGAGASVIFVGLQFAAIHAVCPYCLLAEAAALVLAYVALRDSPRSDHVRAGSIAALTAVVLATIYVFTPPPPAGSDYATRLARYLTQSGAVMYGAYWCPHCRDQKAIFGPAARLLPYVECDPRGAHAEPDRCRARGIRVYPTWEFRGRLVEGVLTLDELAQRSGYPSRQPGQ
jgi:uncharacterized membrane protein